MFGTVSRLNAVAIDCQLLLLLLLLMMMMMLESVASLGQ
jgi:hypothetical protein